MKKSTTIQEKIDNLQRRHKEIQVFLKKKNSPEEEKRLIAESLKLGKRLKELKDQQRDKD